MNLSKDGKRLRKLNYVAFWLVLLIVSGLLVIARIALYGR